MRDTKLTSLSWTKIASAAVLVGIVSLAAWKAQKVYLGSSTNTNQSLLWQSEQPVPLGWCSSGGGHRAMFSAIGYARAFYNGGILDDPSLQVAGANSGGSWFLTQFAFSESFFNSVTTGNLDDLVEQWLLSASEFYNVSCIDLDKFEENSSYEDIKSLQFMPCQSQVHHAKSLLTSVSVLSFMDTSRADADLDAAVSYVKTILRSKINWAEFIIQTLNTTTPDMADAVASPAGRVGGLKTPWLHFQAAIAGSGFTNKGTVSNYGSVGNSRTTPAASLPHQFIVPSLSSGKDTMQSSYQAIPAQMKLRSSFVYQTPNSTVDWLQLKETQETIETSTNSLGEQSNPPKATLVASMSSAAAGFVGTPMGLFESLKQRLPSAVYDAVLAAYTLFSVTGSIPGNKYISDFITDSTNLAVCTSPATSSGVPEECTYPYQRMIDGVYVDNMALAQTVGEMQKRFPKQQLRFITVNNSPKLGANYDTQRIFANSQFTKGIKPGEVIPSGLGPSAPSCQAFEADWEDINEQYQLVGEGAGNITYVEVTTKTVENPAYGIQAGTIVNLLMFDTISEMPVFLPFQDNSELEQWEIEGYQAVVQATASPLVTKIASDWTAKTEYAQPGYGSID
uniref:PLA2c domain-containing protein n=1 Tax=Ditylum brightwellii TaxID=49249 RepID=A0A7S4SGG9_9STRA